jgi:hypothetical protein
VVLGISAGFVTGARATRAIAGMFTIYAGADVLQLIHGEAKSEIADS